MENRDKTAIAGARLVDGTKRAVIENALILIEGAHLKYAGPYLPDFSREGWEVLEGRGKTILPGLVECHVHLGGTDSDNPIEWVLEDDRMQAMKAVKQAETLLSYGFTSARDISRNGLSLKKAIESGILDGPRLVACGPGLSRTGGHGDAFHLPKELVNRSHPWSVLADGEEEVRKAVRSLLKDGSDYIKVWATGGGLNEWERETDQHYREAEIRAAVEEASLLGRNVCAHCESLAGVKAALRAGVKTIEHGEELDEECIRLMLDRDVALVPTLSVFLKWHLNHEPPYRPVLDSFPGETLSEKEINRIVSNFKFAFDAGISIGIGSDSFSGKLTPYGAYSFEEIYALCDAGMSSAEAIAAATGNGARILGINQVTGTVEAGKYADLLILDENPLDDIRLLNYKTISCVVKEGRRYEHKRLCRREL